MKAIRAMLVIALVASAAALHAEDNPDPSVPCLATIEGKPELQVLKGKIALGSQPSSTLEMLANTKKPTAAEKAALSS